MININELRPAVEAAGLNASSMQEVLELLDRLEAAESVLKDFGTTAQEVECWLERYRCIEREAEALRTRLEAAEADALEQARLNGMGGEREAALMAKLEASESIKASYKNAFEISENTIRNLTEKVIPNIRKKLEAAEKERDELRAKIIGLVQAPATKVAQIAAAPAGQLARVFGAYAAKEAA